MGNTYTYDLKQHSFILAPFATSGFSAIVLDDLSEGSSLSITFDSDAWLEKKNATGGGTRSRSNDLSASVKFSVPKESNLNKKLTAILNADTAGDLSGAVMCTFTAKNNLNNEETAFADECWIKKSPDRSYEQNATDIEWEVRTFNMVVV